LLQKHRPQRPLDGLVLTIPCTDLLREGELTHQQRQELEQKAASLYKKLWQAQKILGMRLPVYILITKCDEITGFSSFGKQLPEKLLDQMFGWSNPSTLDTAYRPELIDQAFESIHKHLSWLQFEIYVERDEIEDADDLFLLPVQVQSMRESLSVYLDHLFKQSAYHESYMFRGIYLCGEAAAATHELLKLDSIDEFPEIIDAPLDDAPAAIERKPAFLSDLFKRKIFNESSLAQPIRRIALARNRTALAAQLLSLLIVLVGGTGLVFAYNRLAKQEDQLYRFLMEEDVDLKKMEGYYADPARRNPDATTREELLNRKGVLLEGGETRLITGMANMNANKFGSWFIPTSWFSRINDRLEHSVAAAFKYVIFESLRLDMQRRGKALLTAYPTLTVRDVDPPENPAMADETDAAPVSQLDENFQLSIYMEELGDYRVNLERYNQLISKHPDSLIALRQIVNYLDHPALPDNFEKTNSLYEKAIVMALGRPLDSARFYKDSANRVGDLVEDFYAASFSQNGVTYAHLDDIAEAEALLNRPDYTWLATKRFRICGEKSSCRANPPTT
jgi:type VI secretion system protein ImpL